MKIFEKFAKIVRNLSPAWSTCQIWIERNKKLCKCEVSLQFNILHSSLFCACFSAFWHSNRDKLEIAKTSDFYYRKVNRTVRRHQLHHNLMVWCPHCTYSGYCSPAMRRQATVGKISHEKTRSQQLWLDLKEMAPTSDAGCEQELRADKQIWQ